MIGENIDNNLAIVHAKDKTYKKSELLERFKEFLNAAGYDIVSIASENRSPYLIIISDKKGTEFSMTCYLKNVTHAGWSRKLHTKRVQVKNVMSVVEEGVIVDRRTNPIIILGYYNFDNNPLMVAWDAYRYTNHKTLRSCYVGIPSLLRGYRKGYHSGIDSSNQIWIFNSLNFNRFLNEYMLYDEEGI